MFNFLHTYNPDPVLLQIEWLSIRWYGFLMVLAIIIGIFFSVALAKRYQIRKEDIFDMAFYAIIFGLIGARIYYVLYSWSYYQDNLIDILKIWEGGLAIHGVIIGGFTAIFVFAKKRKVSFGKLADVIAPALALGQVLGRWGNYFNQEIFGTPTDLPWGIPIEAVNRPVEYSGFEFFHPTFLYESILNLFSFAVLILIHRFRIKNPTRAGKPGNIFVYYLMIYSAIRFTMEFWRTDQSPLIFSQRWAQVFSILVFVGCLMVLIVRKIIKK